MNIIRQIPTEFFLCVICIILSLSGCERNKQDQYIFPDKGFTSKRYVEDWENAMVAGNGETGALVYGLPYQDTIILSKHALYMPLHEPIDPVNTAAHTDTIRKMMYAGEYDKASQFAVELSREQGYGIKRWTDPFVPGFDIIINQDEGREVQDYYRTVNFKTGEVICSWRDNRGHWLRRMFVSRSDSMVVISLTNMDGEDINCSVSADRRPLTDGGYFNRGDVAGSYEVKTEGNVIRYRGKFQNNFKGSLEGCEGIVKVNTRGGKIQNRNSAISVENAREIIITARLYTSYDMSVDRTGIIKASLEKMGFDYQNLLKRHAGIHGELYNRTNFSLAGDKDPLLLEQLTAKMGQRPSRRLLELQFDAARYNILSASGVNLPNLQGIWSGDWAPDWSGDYTQNGNLPVAISSFLPLGFEDFMHSYFNYQMSRMDDYKRNAELLYGTKGIHVPSRTSSHGLNNHFDRIWPMTFWTSGAGWSASFFYDYWLYTGDTVFLKNTAFPFMKEAMAFYEDFLIKGSKGKYVFAPSYSPENQPGNSDSQACINATMDIMVAKELLRNCMQAARITGDTLHLGKWKRMLDDMPAYGINDDGVLREWIWPGLEENYSHRHVSHFYSFLNMKDPEFYSDSILFQAARTAVEKRMQVRRQDKGGVMAFGLVQMAMAASNLDMDDVVYEALGYLSTNYWTESLMTTHDPGYIFNFDLSGGFPALIIKMLLYSEPGYISLLPSLPEQWTEGSIYGIWARGGIYIEKLEWNENNIEVLMRSERRQYIEIEVPGDIDREVIELPADKNVKLKIGSTIQY